MMETPENLESQVQEVSLAMMETQVLLASLDLLVHEVLKEKKVREVPLEKPVHQDLQDLLVRALDLIHLPSPQCLAKVTPRVLIH